MIRRARQRRYLFWGLTGLVVLGWLVNRFPPDSWQIISIFFFVLFISVFFISWYLLHNVRRAVLLSLGLTILLFLRLWGLRQPLYPILLVASLLSLELLFHKR